MFYINDGNRKSFQKSLISKTNNDNHISSCNKDSMAEITHGRRNSQKIMKRKTTKKHGEYVMIVMQGDYLDGCLYFAEIFK